MLDPIRALWDFDDLDGTERRLRSLLEFQENGPARAETLTQLARVRGLRGDFDDGERLVQEAERASGDSARAKVLVDLERGRLLRSGGDETAALPLFERALETAEAAGEHFLAADAAHMAALVASNEVGFVAWTERGIAIAQTEPSARYWLGPLLNNLGWERYEADALEEALSAFERALGERERDPANADAIRLARYAIAKTLRALGRPSEAVEHAEWAVESAESEGKPDGWYHEELAETYAALGRHGEAATHAGRALALLPESDSSFERDSERGKRLRDLAADKP